MPPIEPSRAGASDTIADTWVLPRARILCRGRPRLMGVINVTPDSFSDGGRWADPRRAVEHGLRLAAEGADILDVGGESTRPYADPVGVDEELHRVIPVVEQVCRRLDVPVSIDTSKSQVAREAIAAGAQIINDVTGLTGDPDMVPLAVHTAAAVCAMHMQGTPRTMQDNPSYTDVVGEVMGYLRQRRDALIRAGVLRERIAVDPGIGFGKTREHNLTLLGQSGRLHELGCPVLIGYSRKAFIGKLLGDKNADRTAANIGIGLALARQGVQILRVHEVRPLRDALTLFDASGGWGI